MPVKLNGATSGYVQLSAPAVAGSTSLELPTDSIKPGLVLITESSFTAATSVVVNNCFSSTYSAYRIVLQVDPQSATSSDLSLRLRASGTDNSANSYVRQELLGYVTTVQTNAVTATSVVLAPSFNNVNPQTPIVFDLFDPAAAKYTTGLGLGFSYQVSAGVALRVHGFSHNVSSAFDGFSLTTTQNITGSARVYGYRNSL